MINDIADLEVYGALVQFDGRPVIENDFMRRVVVTIQLVDTNNKQLSDPEIVFRFRMPVDDRWSVIEAEQKAVEFAAKQFSNIGTIISKTQAVDLLRKKSSSN